MSLRDPRAWGKDYGVFKVRDLNEYEAKMGNAWALPANEDNKDGRRYGSLGPMSRGCPGKDLSMEIVIAFVSEFVEHFGDWVVTDGTSGGIKFKDCTPFVKSNFAKLARVNKKGYFTMHRKWHASEARKTDYYLEANGILRSYTEPEDWVSDDAEANSESWDLSRPGPASHMCLPLGVWAWWVLWLMQWNCAWPPAVEVVGHHLHSCCPQSLPVVPLRLSYPSVVSVLTFFFRCSSILLSNHNIRVCVQQLLKLKQLPWQLCSVFGHEV